MQKLKHHLRKQKVAKYAVPLCKCCHQSWKTTWCQVFDDWFVFV